MDIEKFISDRYPKNNVVTSFDGDRLVSVSIDGIAPEEQAQLNADLAIQFPKETYPVNHPVSTILSLPSFDGARPPEGIELAKAIYDLQSITEIRIVADLKTGNGILTYNKAILNLALGATASDWVPISGVTEIISLMASGDGKTDVSLGYIAIQGR